MVLSLSEIIIGWQKENNKEAVGRVGQEQSH